MPLGDYERQRVVAIYQHSAGSLTSTEIVNLLECEGISTTR